MKKAIRMEWLFDLVEGNERISNQSWDRVQTVGDENEAPKILIQDVDLPNYVFFCLRKKLIQRAFSIFVYSLQTF